MAGLGDFLQDLYGEAAPSRKSVSSNADRLNEALDAFTRARDAALQDTSTRQAAPSSTSARTAPDRGVAELSEHSLHILAILRAGGPQPLPALIERSELEISGFLDAFTPLRAQGLVHSFARDGGELFELTPDGLGVAQQAGLLG